jgi:phage recombination protein Bet
MTATTIAKAPEQTNLPAIAKLAGMLSIDTKEFEQAIRRTICGPAEMNDAQISAFLIVASEYRLNPLTRQVFPIKAKNGQILPVVSIDGWLRIINEHPDFDGMEFRDNMEGGRLVSITCRMFRKGRSRPTEVTEYMVECMRSTDPWQKWPARMLRHKATIQAARYAFGLAGIYDPDEAERIGIKDMGTINVETGEITPPPPPPDSKAEAAKDVLRKGKKDKGAPAEAAQADAPEQNAPIEGEARVIPDGQDVYEDLRAKMRATTTKEEANALMAGMTMDARKAINPIYSEKIRQFKAESKAA